MALCSKRRLISFFPSYEGSGVAVDTAVFRSIGIKVARATPLLERILGSPRALDELVWVSPLLAVFGVHGTLRQ